MDKRANEILRHRNGARFYKCALQVNPFSWVQRHRSRQTAFADEESYNRAMVDAARRAKVEVIALMDHNETAGSASLARVASEAGITVFPGFEAESRDGVHFLCLFEPGTEHTEIERRSAALRDGDATRSTSVSAAHELLDKVSEWGVVCIAAHVADNGKGLLSALSGPARIEAWRSPHLAAVALAKPLADTDDSCRDILQNRQAEYHRDRLPAVVYAGDVWRPEHFDAPTATSWIKMSSLSLDGLRQAFLDPESRVRVDAAPQDGRTQIEGISWTAGFLDGQALRLNPRLNVLIGGRGAGKSTVIESLRFALALEPFDGEVANAHRGIVQKVLGPGTRVSVLVRSHHPTGDRRYLVERTVGDPPVVRDEHGSVQPLSPRDVFPSDHIYGQHEIGELAKKKELRIELLRRFIQRDEDREDRKKEMRRKLRKSREKLATLESEIESAKERLDSLPVLQERLSRFEQAGLEARFQERSMLIRESQLLRIADERLRDVEQVVEQVASRLPLDLAFLSEQAIAGLPNAELLRRVRGLLEKLQDDMTPLATEGRRVVVDATSGLSSVRQEWQQHEADAQERYQDTLRSLQEERGHVGGEEFISIRKRIESLRPLSERAEQLARSREAFLRERSELLVEWRELLAEDLRAHKEAAQQMSRLLERRVWVGIEGKFDLLPLRKILQERLRGQGKSQAIQALEDDDAFSISKLVAACRSGADALRKGFPSLPANQAAALAALSESDKREIEEIELQPCVEIKLNIHAPNDVDWRELDDLSTGQKATAILLILLYAGDDPLVIDQPEDDLDNRFISESVVQAVRHEKDRRQLILATHNANIPVLGDAELMVVLQPQGHDRAEMPEQDRGAIDDDRVRSLVGELLEGGRDAFQTRRLKYGF